MKSKVTSNEFTKDININKENKSKHKILKNPFY